jgi:hypothetical protein
MIFWRQEWREREKETTVIDQGLAEFWLLQVYTNIRACVICFNFVLCIIDKSTRYIILLIVIFEGS